MWRQSVQPTFTRDCIGDILDAIATAAPLNEILNGAECRLFINAFDPNPDMTVGQFTTAAFVGYALVTPLAWSAPVNVDPNGRLVHVEADFVAGAIVAPELVEGYYITTAAGAAVLVAERFVEPVNFVNPGDFLSLDLVLELPYTWPVTPPA